MRGALILTLSLLGTPVAFAQGAPGMIGQTTTGANAAKTTAGAAKPLPSTLDNRTYAPGTREDFERHPLPQDHAIAHIGSLPVRVRAPVTPAYNGAGTYSTVAGKPANGRGQAMSAQMMSTGAQGQDIPANPAPIP